MSDNDNYEEQVELREQEAYNAAMSEAGREADRMQSEHGAYVAELEARIAKLEAQQRWVPVSERLPDNWESVLTIDISKSTQDVVTAFYNPEISLWSTHFSCDLWVTHWMPLPEPPIVYGKVCEE